MIKIKSLLCVLLLIVSVYGYAQGEAAGNDWSKMGLKGKVKSVKTSIYFAEEKTTILSKVPLSLKEFILLKKLNSTAKWNEWG